MEQSILKSIKLQNDIPEDETTFDDELIGLINMSLATLNQMGPGQQVYLEDDNMVWDDFFTSIDSKLVRALSRQYVAMNVKSKFDVPVTAKASDNITNALEELQFRIYTAADMDYANSLQEG